MHHLEQVLINTCSHFGLNAHRTQDTGVWVGNNKIAALGIILISYDQAFMSRVELLRMDSRSIATRISRGLMPLYPVG